MRGRGVVSIGDGPGKRHFRQGSKRSTGDRRSAQGAPGANRAAQENMPGRFRQHQCAAQILFDDGTEHNAHRYGNGRELLALEQEPDDSGAVEQSVKVARAAMNRTRERSKLISHSLCVVCCGAWPRSIGAAVPDDQKPKRLHIYLRRFRRLFISATAALAR